MNRFDEKEHNYFIDEIKVPSVTQIIQDILPVDFRFVHPKLLERAKNFGKAVHKATELNDKGILDGLTVDEPLIAYLLAWQRFKEDFKVELRGVEIAMYSPKYMFAGTIDRVAVVNGVFTIIDIKTSSQISPTTALQTAGYRLLNKGGLEPPWPDNRLCVRLTAKGKYQVKEYNDEQDEKVFLSCLTLYHYKNKSKRRK